MHWVDVCILLVLVSAISALNMQTIVDIKATNARHLQQARMNHENWNKGQAKGPESD
jgi:hypothetical protein